MNIVPCSNQALTIRNLVALFAWLAKTPQNGIGMDVDCHSKQEQNLAQYHPRVVEPGRVVADEVCEVASLDITIHQAEKDGKQDWKEGRGGSFDGQRVEEHPALERTKMSGRILSSLKPLSPPLISRARRFLWGPARLICPPILAC